MAIALPARTPFERWHGDGIVFKRHTYEWALPASLGHHLRYDPRLLPVVIVSIDVTADYVQMWELTAEKQDYDTRVFAKGKSNEDHYLRLAVDRINAGYRGSRALPAVSFV